MPNYPNSEVERGVRSRVNGAMEELIRKRDSELRELAGKHAPGPGIGSGPYEKMKVEVSVRFYEALLQQMAGDWIDVLSRQNGKISEADVQHIMGELEAWAGKAPHHIRQALMVRGDSAKLLPRGAIDSLEQFAKHEIDRLIAKHRRELQTRLYNQDHPHPKEIAPTPNISITNKINSDNSNSTVASSFTDGPHIVRKGWWETWWGVIATGVIVTVVGGLILARITSSNDKPPERIVTFAVSGSFENGWAYAPSSTVTIDVGTGSEVAANITIADSGERFTGTPAYADPTANWEWQNQGTFKGSLQLQNTATFVNFTGGFIPHAAYWTPELGRIVNSKNTFLKPIANSH